MFWLKKKIKKTKYVKYAGVDVWGFLIAYGVGYDDGVDFVVIYFRGGCGVEEGVITVNQLTLEHVRKVDVRVVSRYLKARGVILLHVESQRELNPRNDSIYRIYRNTSYVICMYISRFYFRLFCTSTSRHVSSKFMQTKEKENFKSKDVCRFYFIYRKLN